jgi:cell division protein FtsW
MATRSVAVRKGRSSSRSRSHSTAETRLSRPSVLITITCAALLGLGLVMILSASSVAAFTAYGSSYKFFFRQLIWAAIGVVAFIAMSRLDYKRLKGVGYVLYAAAAVMLVAVLVPGVGITVGGSSRWIGFGPLTFQPSELAKLALILFAADVFSRKQESLLDDPWHTILPMVPALGVTALLVMMQPDLGTTLLLGSIGLTMLFIAGAPLRHIAPLGLLGIGLAAAGSLSADYRRARVFAFLDPWADPLNTGYQTIQSLIALGSGGWFGVGLGASRQKWSYIPNAHTDFIFAILGEEMGLFGTLVVIGMFSFLAYLGLRTARRAPDRFGMLVAAGITVWITVQAIVNIGAVTSMLPITGVPLPLVSFGGSSLVILLAACGILTNIARQGEVTRSRPKKKR